MRAPWPVATIGAASLALCGSFAVTGPWMVGTTPVRYWAYLLAACSLALGATNFHARSRAWWRETLRPGLRLRWPALAVTFTVCFAFLLTICVRRYLAFQVNAWDFSISFDRPIAETVHGNLLWSDTLGMSMLGIHCNWMLLAFVPLYAIAASPYWLIAAQPLAIVGAMAVLFFYARYAAGDDVVAMGVALAFLFNRYTVRAINPGFLVDIFYPLGMLLLVYAFRRSRVWLGCVATILLLTIKEDAIVTLAGFAIVIAMRHRAWRWAAATLIAATLVFVVDYYYVMPAFNQSPVPFAHWWGSFGATPVSASIGMLGHPIEVIGRVIPSAFRLLLSMGFLPLIGGDWMLAATPAIVAYTSADREDMHWLALHYSLPVLGLLFAAAADGIARLAPRWRRAAAVVLVAFSLFAGSSYKAERPRPERAAIPRLLAAAGARRVFVQGALFPHVGYREQNLVLHHDVTVTPDDAFLFCTSCAPYPFSRQEFEARLASLMADGRYRRLRAGDLWLFVPDADR